MEDTRRVKFNVGGRIFEMTWATLKRIPTLFHMMTDCQDTSEMFIDRSPMLFEQVFAFVVDEKHPFPLRYSYELDWYDVVYDKLKLYDDEAWMPIQVYNSRLYFQVLQNAITETTCWNRWEKCIKSNCGVKLSDTCNPLCKDCRVYCLEPSCTELTTRHSYCSNHNENNIICNRKGCFRHAVPNLSRCGVHVIIAPKK
jgi:hypothetical protein